MERLRRDFSTTTIVLIPVAIAINLAIGEIVRRLGLPLYLDSIGTIFAGVVGGPIVGALTGLISNVIWGLLGNVQYVPFAAVAAVIGGLAAFFSMEGWFRQWWRAILAGVITGTVAALLSAPISAYVFGGITGAAGQDALVAIFRELGMGIMGSAFLQGFASDPLDKALSFFVVWLVLRSLPRRFLDRFPYAEPEQ